MKFNEVKVQRQNHNNLKAIDVDSSVLYEHINKQLRKTCRIFFKSLMIIFPLGLPTVSRSLHSSGNFEKFVVDRYYRRR